MNFVPISSFPTQGGNTETRALRLWRQTRAPQFPLPQGDMDQSSPALIHGGEWEECRPAAQVPLRVTWIRAAQWGRGRGQASSPGARGRKRPHCTCEQEIFASKILLMASGERWADRSSSVKAVMFFTRSFIFTSERQQWEKQHNNECWAVTENQM